MQQKISSCASFLCYIRWRLSCSYSNFVFLNKEFYQEKIKNLNIEVPSYIHIAEDQIDKTTLIPCSCWKEGGTGLSLPEKKSCLRLEEFTFLLFSLTIFLIFFCSQINPVYGAAGETTAGEENQNRIIIDFFSDHELSDAKVRFEKPHENVSLVFTLSSGKETPCRFCMNESFNTFITNC